MLAVRNNVMERELRCVTCLCGPKRMLVVCWGFLLLLMILQTAVFWQLFDRCFRWVLVFCVFVLG